MSEPRHISVILDEVMKLIHIQWSKNLFASLKEKGMWGVPRSGLMFQKQGANMVLTERMPYTPEMAEAAKKGRDVPASKEALEQYQQEDFDCIAAHFRAAGVEVADNTKGNK